MVQWLWLGTLDREVSSQVRVLVAVVWHWIHGQGTLPVCALCRPRSEWVPG